MSIRISGRLFGLAAVLAVLLAAVPASAAELACPPLSTAKQVGNCPTEEELRIGFNGYCSDNARAYDKAEDVTCLSFENYRKKKNVSLWEAGDGSFEAYLSCEGGEDAVKARKALQVGVARVGAMTKVGCDYEGEITFIKRTKAQCRVVGDRACGPDGTACKVECD